MAFVAITAELRTRVRNKIVKMRDLEISSTLPRLGLEYHIDARDMWIAGAWGDQKALHNVIPKDWLTPQNYGSITVTGMDDEGYQIKESVAFKTLTECYRRPSRSSYYGTDKCEMTIDEVKAFPVGTPGREELIQRFEDGIVRQQIMRRWSKVESDMDMFLCKCKSLNEAIKLMPAVKMYVHADDIERVERKVERKPRTELIANVDTDGLTAAAVAARLMGAA